MIRQPKIKQIVEYGESRYWATVMALTAIPSDYKSTLWDSGVDYEEITDFAFFASLVMSLSIEDTSLLFGELNFADFVPIKHPSTNEMVLYNTKSDCTIDPAIHHRISEFLCKAHNIKKKKDIAMNALTKRVLIDTDRQDKLYASKKETVSVLRPLVSSMVCFNGLNYNYETIQNMTICQLFDAVERSQIITSTFSLLSGAYSGFCDTSKVDKGKFDWFRDKI